MSYERALQSLAFENQLVERVLGFQQTAQNVAIGGVTKVLGTTEIAPTPVELLPNDAENSERPSSE